MSKFKQCAFLTMEQTDGFFIDDDLAIPYLNDLGWQVSTIPWQTKNVDWDQFDCVIVRSTWDYQDDLPAFQTRLQTINQSKAVLANPLHVMMWNTEKTYLRDLQSQGVAIVPTQFDAVVTESAINSYFDHFDCDELVLKPHVGGSASHTYRLKRGEVEGKMPAFCTSFQNRPFMAQPFLNEIVTEGEFSLFFFNGQLSHTMLKTPAPENFRVQEEFGSQLQLVEPESRLLQTANDVLSAIDTHLLYARVDFVRDAGSGFSLMELELIEPGLYLRMASHAPLQFAKAIDEWVTSRKPSFAGAGVSPSS